MDQGRNGGYGNRRNGSGRNDHPGSQQQGGGRGGYGGGGQQQNGGGERGGSGSSDHGSSDHAGFAGRGDTEFGSDGGVADSRGGGPSRGGGQSRGAGQPGGGQPAASPEFLQLEMSQVLYGEAASMTHDAFRELLYDAIVERLYERMGDRIEGLARLAADELADDVEANLAVEAKVSDRSQSRENLRARVRDVFKQAGPGATGSADAAEGDSEEPQAGASAADPGGSPEHK